MNGVQQTLRAIVEADQGRPRKNVTILGAGMAGLVAGYELVRLGHDVTLIEANSRIGGRVWTHRFHDGTYGELGAMRIPGGHEFTKHYAEVAGCTLRQFLSSHQNLDCYYHIRGVRTRIRDAPETLFPHFALSETQQQVAKAPDLFGAALVFRVVNLLRSEQDELLDVQPHSDRPRALDRMSIRQFLRESIGDDATELVGLTTGTDSFYDRAITMVLRDALADEGDKLHEIVGGMDQLPLFFGQELQGRIRLKHEVRGIRRLNDGRVRVDVVHHGLPHTLESDFVLCTLPFTVMRTITVDPPFSKEKQECIHNLGYISSTRVLLHSQRRFWETDDGIFGGASHTDQLNRAVYYPSDNLGAESSQAARQRHSTLYSGQTVCQYRGRDETISSGPGVLLAAYNWGRDAQILGQMKKRDRRRLVTGHIEQLHPQIRGTNLIDDAKSVFWDKQPGMKGGAFSFLMPDQHNELYRHAISPEDNVHFAGEHCSLENAWIQSAITSALRAVTEIVRS